MMYDLITGAWAENLAVATSVEAETFVTLPSATKRVLVCVSGTREGSSAAWTFSGGSADENAAEEVSPLYSFGSTGTLRNQRVQAWSAPVDSDGVAPTRITFTKSTATLNLSVSRAYIIGLVDADVTLGTPDDTFPLVASESTAGRVVTFWISRYAGGTPPLLAAPLGFREVLRDNYTASTDNREALVTLHDANLSGSIAAPGTSDQVGVAIPFVVHAPRSAQMWPRGRDALPGS